MDQSKIFIIGANGQLGTALRKKYPKSRHADIKDLDITDRKSVKTFDWSDVEVIINAAAYTSVDGAETNDGRVSAWKVNADAVANLVAVAAQFNATLVHISTDYVFNGSKDAYSESDAFSPLSVYGASKAAGDLVVSLAPKFYIIRTSWVIGDGSNFVRTMIGLADKNISPTVVDDQIGRLTFTAELVRAIDHLLTSEQKLPYGTYNVSNCGPSVSWADITRKIFVLLKRDDLSVTNVTTAKYYKNKKGIAPRPLNSTLSMDKIQATGLKSRDWQNELQSYINKEHRSKVLF